MSSVRYNDIKEIAGKIVINMLRIFSKINQIKSNQIRIKKKNNQSKSLYLHLQ